MGTAKKRKVSKRKVSPPTEGADHRIYRKLVAGTVSTYESVPKDRKGRVIDSIVHRYIRTLGFKMSKEDEGDIESNALMRETHSRAGVVVDKTANAIRSQSMFECYTLQYLHGTDYYRYLKSLAAQFDIDGQPKKIARKDAIAFLVPSKLAVINWMHYLNTAIPVDNIHVAKKSKGPQGRGNCAKTIETRIGGLSTASKQGGKYTMYVALCDDELKTIKVAERDLLIKEAPPFDVGHDLPALHAAVFDRKNKIGWSGIRRVEFFAAFMAQINIIGRASCVSEYSPKWEDVEYPQHFESDGLPAWVILKLTDWKQKKPNNEGGKDLEFMIYRNTLDSRFCFVYYFFQMQNMLADLGKDIVKGPIFGHIFGTGEGASIKCRNAEKHMFKVASNIHPDFAHLAECSSHSVRRTMAQWADTCKYDAFNIMQIGRWLDINTFKKYVEDNKILTKKSEAVDTNYRAKGRDLFVFTTKVFPA
jgi:hypothetical protein